MVTKKSDVFEKTREILSRHEVKGISKNHLATLLHHEKVASRMTFLSYFDEMADPKRGNIIEQRTPKGKIFKLCFPTASNQVIGNLRKKFKIAKSVLGIISSDPFTGDLFRNLPNLKNYRGFQDLAGVKTPDVRFTPSFMVDYIRPTKTSDEPQFVITFNAHTARKDFLQTLPSFLTLYINSKKLNLSKQVKEECFKVITPIILDSFRIFSRDYSESIGVSVDLKEKIQDTLNSKAAVIVEQVKGELNPDVEIEFLKILGRYSYSINAKSGGMLFNSSERTNLANFVKAFYGSEHENSMDSLSDADIENFLRIVSRDTIHTKGFASLKSEFGISEDSVALRLVRDFAANSYSDDPIEIKQYYIGFFIQSGIFNKVEQQILRYVLRQEEDFIKRSHK